jgi:hypothetical protein
MTNPGRSFHRHAASLLLAEVTGQHFLNLEVSKSLGEGTAWIRAVSSSLITRTFHERIQSGDKTMKKVKA